MEVKDIPRFKKRFMTSGVRFIDLKYPSLTGALHHITAPFERFVEIIKEGVGIDGSSLPGYKGVEKGDMLLFPDLGTYFFDPFFEQKTVSFLCSAYTINFLPFSRDPRHIAQKAVIYLKKEIKTEVFFLPELEFYLLSHNPTYPIRHKGGYHIGPPEDEYYNLRNTIVETLSACGIKSKYHHHEVGPKGQMEIELMFEPLLRTADNIFVAKYIIKCVGEKHNKLITFMPKPFLGEPGNGLHIHQYLGSKNRSLFYNANKQYSLSPLCLNYIGGILHHARALCAFTNPSTNSYKRLIPGFEAPTYADFAVGSRTTAIRLPGYIKNKQLMEIEYRIPDATANPYLALATILLAGVDGIKNRLTAEKREKLPTNVYEAVNALKEDHDFLLQGNVFTEDLIERWIDVKTKEFEEVHIRPHPHEFTLYLGV